MAAAWVGYVLFILGALFLIVGLIGAVKKVVLEHPAVKSLGAQASIPWGDILKALLKAGPWGICTAVGLVLVIVGLIILGAKIPGIG